MEMYAQVHSVNHVSVRKLNINLERKWLQYFPLFSLLLVFTKVLKLCLLQVSIFSNIFIIHSLPFSLHSLFFLLLSFSFIGNHPDSITFIPFCTLPTLFFILSILSPPSLSIQPPFFIFLLHPFLSNLHSSSFFSILHLYFLFFIFLLHSSSFFSILHPSSPFFIFLLHSSSFFPIRHLSSPFFIFLLHSSSFFSILHPSSPLFVFLLHSSSFFSILHLSSPSFFFLLYSSSFFSILHPHYLPPLSLSPPSVLIQPTFFICLLHPSPPLLPHFLLNLSILSSPSSSSNCSEDIQVMWE